MHKQCIVINTVMCLMFASVLYAIYPACSRQASAKGPIFLVREAEDQAEQLRCIPKEAYEIVREKGKEFLIELEAHPDAGHVWEVADVQPKGAMRVIKSSYYPETNKQEWIVAVHHAGEITMRFINADGVVQKKKTYDVQTK